MRFWTIFFPNKFLATIFVKGHMLTSAVVVCACARTGGRGGNSSCFQFSLPQMALLKDQVQNLRRMGKSGPDRQQ